MKSDEVRARVGEIPEWLDADIAVRPLPGGITNQNFVATVDGTPYVVRIPGERTELLGIDRVNEKQAARRAADLGVGPGVVGELPGVGTLITRFIPGGHLESDDFVLRLPDVVALLKRFHSSGPMTGAFPIHRVVEWHARDAGAHGVIPPSSYERLHQQSRRIEAAFAAAPTTSVPCHNDLLPANVLFDSERVWLLDFEYAGMNDVFFDLANLSVNNSFDDDADQLMLRSYFGAVTPTRLARLHLMKMMSEFREGMWAVVQQAISHLETDFVAYADERLGRCERLAARTEFERWLDDARSPVL